MSGPESLDLVGRTSHPALLGCWLFSSNRCTGLAPSPSNACCCVHRPISARPFLAKQVEEQADCFFLPLEMMDHLLARCADTPPAPGQAGIAEQGLLDCHRIVAGHVFRSLGPLDVDMVGLCDHDGNRRG